jgi:hypothetical protein
MNKSKNSKFISRVDFSSGCKQEPFSQTSSNLDVPRKTSSNFIQIQTLEVSLIFRSKLILNLRTILQEELFLISNPSQPYFISNFLTSGRPSLNQNKFDFVLKINKKRKCNSYGPGPGQPAQQPRHHSPHATSPPSTAPT